MPAKSTKSPKVVAKDITRIVAIGLFIVIGYLALKNLDAAYLWDDESETATFARNLLQQGKLTAWDGRNLFAFRNGTTFDDNFRSRQPPLMFLATAASFAVFGASTWTARLPFVLAGLAALYLMYRLLRRVYASEPLIALYGVAVMGLSMPFLLNLRQCRYYSLCLLGSVLVFDQYERCVHKDGRLRHSVGLGLAAAAMFMAHYLVCAVFLLTLGCIHAAFYLRASKQAYVRIVCGALLFLVCTVPYAVAYTIWSRPDIPDPTDVWYISRPKLALLYLRDLNEINALPVVMFVALVILAIAVRARRQQVLLFLGLTLINTAIMGALSPQPYKISEPADVRYLIASLPFASIAIALLLASLHKRGRGWAWAALALLVSSNALTADHKHNFRWLLPAYAREIHMPYPTEQSAVVQALNQRAKQDDLVATIPPFESLPLIFYVGDKVQLCCLLDRASPLVANGVGRQLAPMLVMETTLPRWVVVYGKDPLIPYIMPWLQRAHPELGETKPHTYQLVEQLGVYFKATQRSELMFHQFGPKTDYDRNVDDVYLFERID